MRKGFVIVPLLLLLFTVTHAHVYGKFEMEEDSVEIDFDKYTEPTKHPTRTPTPTQIPSRDYIVYEEEKKQFDELGYVVRTTYPFQKETASLQVDMSSVKVGFSNLKANQPQEKKVDYSATSQRVFSYQVLAWQTDSLRTSNNLIIENTLCNSVKTPCSSSLARSWTYNEASGFGYRLDGVDRPLDFSNNTYRIFPLDLAETTSLFNETAVQNTRKGILYLKINPPPTFQEGSYTTSLKILTIPRL